jgi:hypothetical protein
VSFPVNLPIGNGFRNPAKFLLDARDLLRSYAAVLECRIGKVLSKYFQIGLNAVHRLPSPCISFV